MAFRRIDPGHETAGTVAVVIQRTLHGTRARVVTYSVDPTTGALTNHVSAELPVQEALAHAEALPRTDGRLVAVDLQDDLQWNGGWGQLAAV